MIPRAKTKRERIRQVLDSLPPDAGVFPAGDLDVDEKAIEIHEHGRILVGTSWILPTDYVDDDVAAGRASGFAPRRSKCSPHFTRKS
ncbi:MAG: hypothetical protein GY835_24720 [bacterium]|nr:hypothetical protein [bacterium]